MWSQIRTPSAREPSERDVEIIEGAIHQGVDFLQIAKTLRVGSFVQFDFTRDTKRFDYNNEITFAVGSKVGFPISSWGYLELGAQWERQNRYVSNRRFSGFVGILNWSTQYEWVGHDDKKKDTWLTPLKYVFFSQGAFRFPNSRIPEERRNAFLEGKIEAGIDWVKIGELTTLNTFLGVGFKVDSREIDSRNQLEPSAGALLRFDITKTAFIETGAKLVNEYRFKTHRSETGMIAFINMVTTW